MNLSYRKIYGIFLRHHATSHYPALWHRVAVYSTCREQDIELSSIAELDRPCIELSSHESVSPQKVSVVVLVGSLLF